MLKERNLRKALPVHDFPLQWMPNPELPEILSKVDNLPNFDQVAATLLLDPRKNFTT